MWLVIVHDQDGVVLLCKKITKSKKKKEIKNKNSIHQNKPTKTKIFMSSPSKKEENYQLTTLIKIKIHQSSNKLNNIKYTQKNNKN